MTTQQERIDYLRARLLEPDVQVEEVWDYIALQHPPHQGMVQQNMADFVNPQDLANFRWLYNWWDPVADKPQQLPSPTIMQFCWFVNHTPGAPAITFDAALKQFYDRCVKHCEQHDLDPANPGESADERRKRRNRERMARVRGHRRTPDKVLKKNDALSAQVRSLEGQCDQLKAEAKAVDEELRQQVIEHQQKMIERSDLRKAKAAEFKTLIENIREQIRTLTAKQ